MTDKADEGRAPPRTPTLCEVCGERCVILSHHRYSMPLEVFTSAIAEHWRKGYEREKARADKAEAEVEFRIRYPSPARCPNCDTRNGYFCDRHLGGDEAFAYAGDRGAPAPPSDPSARVLELEKEKLELTQALRAAENQMIAAESQLEWLSDALTGARPVDDFGASFGLVREALDLRIRAEEAEARILDLERWLRDEPRGPVLLKLEAALREIQQTAQGSIDHSMKLRPEWVVYRVRDALASGNAPQAPSSLSAAAATEEAK